MKNPRNSGEEQAKTTFAPKPISKNRMEKTNNDNSSQHSTTQLTLLSPRLVHPAAKLHNIPDLSNVTIGIPFQDITNFSSICRRHPCTPTPPLNPIKAINQPKPKTQNIYHINHPTLSILQPIPHEPSAQTRPTPHPSPISP